MPIWVLIISTSLSIVTMCCGLVLTSRNIKKTSPFGALKQDFEKSKLESDVKFDNDNRRLNRLERDFERMEGLDRLLLRSVKAMLGHLSEGNHTDTMKEEIRKIDEYLISR